MMAGLKHRLFRAFVGALLLTFLFMLPVMAEDAPVAATLTLTPATLEAPGTVQASIQVENVSGAEISQQLSLYDPYGAAVSNFSELSGAISRAGGKLTLSAQVNVSQEMLEAGAVTYTLRYQNEAGEEVRIPVSAAIEYTGSRAGLKITRKIDPEVVRSGQTVKVTYELNNTGTVNISSISVKEKISKNPKTVRSLAAGATTTVEFTAKMGSKDLTSGATVSFKPAGGKQETEVVEDVEIPLAVRNLKVELSTDKSAVDIGQTVKLIMTVQNDGNISYHDVVAVDKTLGTVFSGLTIPANTTFTEEREVMINAPTTFSLKLTLQDNTNNSNTYDTNSVSVSAYDPEKELQLNLLLTADKEGVSNPPEDVSMSLVVTNASNVDCTNIVIRHGELTIYTIPSLAAGQSVTVKRDYTVSQSGRYRFTATAKDALGNNVSFESNTLTLNYLPTTPVPTIAPTATVPPLVTVAPAQYSDTGNILRTIRNSLYTAMFVLGGLAAAALLLFVISTVVRSRKKHVSDSAYDHLDLAERRDYTEPSEDAAENTDSGKTEETKEDAEDATDSVILPQRQETSESTGGFRMRRGEESEEFPVYQEYRAESIEKQASEILDEAIEAKKEAQDTAQEIVDRTVETADPENIQAAEEAVQADARSATLPDRRRRRRSNRNADQG
ncbi:MAG: hypothetical protein IJ240_09750 [Clostridia bacterium]|nr:hypothetical protein [Clostridia bacterium]